MTEQEEKRIKYTVATVYIIAAAYLIALCLIILPPLHYVFKALFLGGSSG